MKKIIITIKAIITAALLSSVFLFPASIYAQETSIAVLTQKAADLGIDESHINRIQERARVNGMTEEQLVRILERSSC